MVKYQKPLLRPKTLVLTIVPPPPCTSELAQMSVYGGLKGKLNPQDFPFSIEYSLSELRIFKLNMLKVFKCQHENSISSLL